jgi:integrase
MEPILMKRGPRFSTLHFRGLAKLTCSNRDTSDSVTKMSPALFEPSSRSELKPILASTRNAVKLEISSINRELQVLRRMFNLAYEWKVVERPLDRVRMLKGENQRDRVLTSQEEKRYLGQAAPLWHDVATVLVDCSLRPEECFRLKPVHVQHGNLAIPWGKAENAVRKIPMTPRVDAIIKVRDRSRDGSSWWFPAPTASGHIEPSSLKKQHAKACRLAKIEPFDLYTFRHTCLTRWAPHMDVFTLQYLAGHSDIRTTRRYVHPQQQDTLRAMARARKAQGGHTSRHTAKKTPKSTGAALPVNDLIIVSCYGAPGLTRTAFWFVASPLSLTP